MVILHKRALTLAHLSNSAIKMWAGLCLIVAVGCSRPTYTQEAQSMSPTIEAGDQVYIDFQAFSKTPPDRWDVVILRPPELDDEGGGVAFRVVGLPGETISFDSEGLLVNGAQPESPPELMDIVFTSAPRNRTAAVSFPFRVPPESFFVLGDDPLRANDSRMWGPVSRERILGKVVGKAQRPEQ